MNDSTTSPGDREQLRTVLVAAFEGWNDAGGAASAVVKHLHDVWDAQQIAEIDPEDYHDFQVTRPEVSTTETGERVLSWPATRVSTARVPESGARSSWSTASSRACAGGPSAASCSTSPRRTTSTRWSRWVRSWPTCRTRDRSR